NWDNGLPATQDQSGLGAGTYCVTVTDTEGCEIQECFDINENDPLEVMADLKDPTCPDAEDGSIDLTVTGGTVDWYTFQWDNGLPPTEDQTGLGAGTYCVTVVDDNGCVVEDCYTLEAPEEIIITGKVTDVSCYNGSDGSIILQVSGGNLPYSYDWNNNLPDQANQTNLTAGTFCVIVTDENGCEGEACFTIEEPDAIEITGDIQNALCLGDNSGSISTTVTGGTAPYNYSWSNGLPSTKDQNNLEAGTYCVTVTDSNDCEETECFIIEEGEAISLSADLTSPTCYNEATGAINLSVDGGEEPYLYNWNNNLPAQEDQNNIEAGTYCVTVTDNQGCQAEDCFTVNNPPKLDGKLIFTQPKCGEDNGTATAQVNGGTGSYSYEWSRNDNGTNSVSGLPEGLISVTVTDDNGCELVLSKELEGSDNIECNAFVVQMVSIRNGQDGIVDVDVSGGNGNYSYNWDLNGSSSTSKQVSGLPAGTYTVEVTDENDCSCISDVTLLNPAKVGDFVWSDLNGNGQQDIGEPGIRNIEVQLTGSDVNGNAINLTTTTDADGSYHFNVKPGTYSIHFAAPFGYIFTNQNNAADDIDSDADANGDTDTFVLNEGEYNPDIDAGLVQNAKVGDFVWFDTDQDGIQDAGEPGVEGVTVRLVQAGPDGIFGNTDDQIVATTISDINGMYMFNNLMPGEYQLIFDINSIPANSMFTLADIGADDTDSDVLGVNGETDTFTLLSGDNRSDLDAGIKSNCSQLPDGGEITGDEEGCSPSFNPGLIAHVSAPGQGQYEYRWYESYINQPFDINSPEWRLIPNANGPSYDPGRIIYSTYFVRVAREKDCEGTAFVPANIIFKEVIGCDIECDNIIHAGLIGFSEIECDPFDPDEIQNVQLPSGGSAGDIEYLWMMTTDDPPSPNTVWIPIQNSNTPNYDPGFVSETTHFMRCARREDCTNYVETNMVVKRVLGDPEAIIENSPATYCIDEETTFTATEFENIHKYEWTFEGADVTVVSGSVATVTWITPGIHTVELTTTDFFGCSNSSEITVEVSNDPNDCPNLSMQITLTASLNNDDQVELEYEAESEMPHVEFIIERTDKENGLFDQMNTISEFMTSGITESFSSMDYNPVYGYNYYRVRMVNEYGTEIASNIAQVLIQEEGQDVFLYPNPLVQDRLTVGSLDYFRAGTTIEILNVEGKVLIQEELDTRSYKEYFSTNGWAEGAYFVRITSPGERPTIIKFLKFNP
ncbi:MAG TPA: SdrD B-like domain-containing protein, partial [Saprospiraceae bacterium]|nr:SdrD B-like domain-containing protein [Saprospiraceae bacterium]